MGRISNPIKKVKSEYREVKAWSYSYIAKYDINRWQFYKRYILKEEEEEENKDSKFLLRGNIVDCLLTDEKNFDNQYLVTSANKPSGQLLTFTNYLFDLKKKDTLGDKTFLELSTNAFELLKEENGGKLQKKYETFIENFNRDGIDYYKELLASANKKVITIEDVTICKELVKKYNNTNPFIFEGLRVVTKVPLFFKIGTEDFKAEIDKLIFDDVNKKIWIRDIKVSAFIEQFQIQGYLKRRYDLQQSIYRFAVESNFPDYKVENFGFEVLDFNNINNPLLYICPEEYYQYSWEGFYFGNKYYKGVIELIEEIKQCLKLDLWHTDLKIYKNNNTIIMSKLKSKEEKMLEFED